jgi:serine/threonine-protein kinase
VDIYAVGVMLYELFTGAVPFTGDSFMAVLTATLHEPPPAMTTVNPELRVGPELQAVIMKALAKDPAARQSSMNELMSEILATPEGAATGRGSIAEARYSSFPGAMVANPTAAQFGAKVGSLVGPGQPTAIAAGHTAQLGTPSAAGTKTTSVGGQSSTVAPNRGAHTGLIVGSLAFVVVTLGAGGYFVSTRMMGEGPMVAGEPSAVPAVAREAASAEPVPVVAAAPVAPATASPGTTIAPSAPTTNEVKLTVETDPPGASLEKDGFQICPETPCEISVIRNEGIELTGKKGSLRGQVKIMPQDDQTVSLKLTAPVARAKPKGPAAEPMCEKFIGELKVLRPCKE